MAKKSNGKQKREKGEPRTQLLYAFDVERARGLRDEKYKGKENLVAVVLRVLCATNKEAYTFAQMAELVKAETGKLPSRAQFPLNKMKSEKILKATKERGEGAVAPKPKKARKPRAKKQTETASETTSEAAA